MALPTRDVQKIYLAYFGRPADPAGLAYWTAQNNLGQVAESFALSTEYLSLFSQGGYTALVTAIYQNLFHRAPDTDGLTYWVDNLQSGAVTPSVAALTILQGALGSDLSTVNVKLDAAETFTTSLDLQIEQAAYRGALPAADVRNFWNGINTASDIPADFSVLLGTIEAHWVNPVQKLYIAYYGRPADPAGLQFWVKEAVANGGNWAALAASFVSSPESVQLYGSASNSDLVKAVYLNVLGRTAEPAGLAYWVGELNSGNKTPADLALAVINAALGSDATTITQRLSASNTFTTQLEAQGRDHDFYGSGVVNSAREWLAGIGADQADLDAALAVTVKLIDSYTAGKVQGLGSEGYLVGTTVFLDSNGNGQFDAGEQSTNTDSNGNFTLPSGASTGSIIATGGINMATGLAFTDTLKAPAGAQTITPLTTLTQTLIEQGLADGVEATENLLFGALNLPRFDLSLYDPLKAGLNGSQAEKVSALQIQAITTQVMNLITAVAAVLTGAGASAEAAQQAVLQSLAQQLSSGQPLDLGLSGNIQNIISQAGSNAGLTPAQQALVQSATQNTATVLSEINTKVQMASTYFADGRITSSVSALSDMFKLQKLTQGELSTNLNSSTQNSTTGLVLDNYTGLTLMTKLDTTQAGSIDNGTPTNDGTTITNPDTGGGDTTAPTLSSFTPLDNATAVAVGTNVVLTFSESVTAVTGKNVVIHKTSDNSIVTSMDAASSQITIAGGVVTINPTANLANSTEFYVRVDAGAFKDAANNVYGGQAVTTAISFTTAAAGGTLTTGGDIVVGTAGDDTFSATYDAGVVTDTFSGSDSLDGSGGTDTLKIDHLIDVAITPPDALWAHITGIEKVVINTTGNGAQTITTGAFFQSAFGAGGVDLTTTTSGSGAIDIAMSTFAGAATLSTTSLAGAQTIVTGSGAATVTATSGAGALTIYGSGLASVTANTTGAGAQTIGDNGGGGANLVSVTAASNSGAQMITSTSTSAVTVHATATGAPQTITTGTGNDLVTATGAAGQSNTIITNAGNDTIVAGLGTDLINGGTGADRMTGGGGPDTFVFGADGSVLGTSMDVITDFNTAGADILIFGASTALLSADATALVAGVNVQQSAGGLISFHATDSTFAQKIVAVQADVQLDAAGSIAMFIDSGNTYVYYAGTATGNADDQLIQLTGIVSLVTITGGGTTTIA